MGHSTDDQLLLFYGQVSRWVDRGDSEDVVILDFSKAFDVDSHFVLLGMLRGLGLDLTVLSWVEGFLLGRSMRVSVSGSMSTSRDVTSEERGAGTTFEVAG